MPSSTTVEMTKLILTNLFDPEEQRMREGFDIIIEENRQLKREPDAVGVMFASGFHDFSWFVAPKVNPYVKTAPPKRITLDHDFHERMQALVDEKLRIEHDKKHISQMLVQLLEPARSLQEVRDTLPECVVEILPQLKSFARLREAGFTLKHPRNKEQLPRIVDRIGFYLGLKFMY